MKPINLTRSQRSRLERAMSHLERASYELHVILERDGEYDEKTVHQCLSEAQGALQNAEVILMMT
jgi:hypothetical protein